MTDHDAREALREALRTNIKDSSAAASHNGHQAFAIMLCHDEAAWIVEALASLPAPTTAGGDDFETRLKRAVAAYDAARNENFANFGSDLRPYDWHRAALIAALANHSPDAAGVGEAPAMTPEEHHLQFLKQMAAYTGPVVSFDVREGFYLASCDHCGWVGSSELCGTDSWGDDSDVYCPRCSSPGADCGKVAARIPDPRGEG